jgi:nucleotide-binding universal stress UspA family protein
MADAIVSGSTATRFSGREVVCGVRDWADVAAAEFAARLAHALGLELTLIHVLPARASWTESGPGDGVLNRPWDDAGAHRLLDAVATAVGAAADRCVAYGAAGQTLAREAAERDAALLVIGPPSRGVVGSALAGSASAHLVRHTGRPLIVCPAPQCRPEAALPWPPLAATA